MKLSDIREKGLKKTLVQFIKFGLVGALNTAISLGVYYLFVWWNRELYLVGSIAGFVLSVLNAYYWNNRYVFRGGATGHLKRLIKTFSAYGGTTLVSTALLALEVEVLHVSEFIAPIVNLCLTIPLNFIIHKFWVYRKKADAPAEGTEPAMEVKLSDYLATWLVERGVDTVFSVTGGGAMHLNDSLGHTEGLSVFYCHHEQACAIAAESYARLTGRMAAVCVTSGPGGTNALTGVMGAYLDSIPMLVVSGQVKRATTVRSAPTLPLRQLGDQEFDIVSCLARMTKYAAVLGEPNDVAYHLARASTVAMQGRPGPVWLDIPLDVQAARIDPSKLRAYDPAEDAEELPPAFSEKQATEILAKIAAAKRPVLLVGGGVRTAGASEAFLALAHRLNIPVVTAWNAHDAMPDDDPLFSGRPGSVGTRGGNFVVQNADLLFSIGCRLNIRQISYNYESFARRAYKIVVDIDEAELQKPTLSIDLPVHADLRDVIAKLLALPQPAENAAHAKWLAWCRETNAAYPAALPAYYEKNSPLNPYVFFKELSKKLPENEVCVTGNGTACVVSFQAMEMHKGGRLYTNSGCASMGYGTPAAIGAAIALRSSGQRVLCFDGDGSFQMNLQELMTIVYHKLPIKLFYLNNNGYQSIRQTQTSTFKEHTMTGVSPENGVGLPDMEKLAAAYGIPYLRIDALDTLSEKLDAALSDNEQLFIEVVLDPAQFFEPKLSSKVLPDGTIVSPAIEDMYPFLPRDEFARRMIAEHPEDLL